MDGVDVGINVDTVRVDVDINVDEIDLDTYIDVVDEM